MFMTIRRVENWEQCVGTGEQVVISATFYLV